MCGRIQKTRSPSLFEPCLVRHNPPLLTSLFMQLRSAGKSIKNRNPLHVLLPEDKAKRNALAEQVADSRVVTLAAILSAHAKPKVCFWVFHLRCEMCTGTWWLKATVSQLLWIVGYSNQVICAAASPARRSVLSRTNLPLF